MKPIYNRILLKLSGEALMGDQEFGISSETITSYAKQIKILKMIFLKIYLKNLE